MIRYRIKPIHPQAHMLEVHLTIENADPVGQILFLPAWIRGSYMIRDFARNLVTLTASCNGVNVAVTKLDKQTWKTGPIAGTLEIQYRVYAWDQSVRGAHVDNTHAYFNGPNVFLGVNGRESESVWMASVGD